MIVLVVAVVPRARASACCFFIPYDELIVTQIIRVPNNTEQERRPRWGKHNPSTNQLARCRFDFNASLLSKESMIEGELGGDFEREMSEPANTNMREGTLASIRPTISLKHLEGQQLVIVVALALSWSCSSSSSSVRLSERAASSRAAKSDWSVENRIKRSWKKLSINFCSLLFALLFVSQSNLKLDGLSCLFSPPSNVQKFSS